MTIGDIVKIINFRSLAYGRQGMITGFPRKGNRKHAIVRFTDLPRLSPQELENPDGLFAVLPLDELEKCDSMIAE